MKVKTSITLSEEVLRACDRLAGKGGNRSQVIEEAVRTFVEARARATRDARDTDILNRRADSLNRELSDALEYQDSP
jgi:metal-responsive CopG/Arc/MetJ family transcriptional regulator